MRNTRTLWAALCCVLVAADLLPGCWAGEDYVPNYTTSDQQLDEPAEGPDYDKRPGQQPQPMETGLWPSGAHSDPSNRACPCYQGAALSLGAASPGPHHVKPTNDERIRNALSRFLVGAQVAQEAPGPRIRTRSASGPGEPTPGAEKDREMSAWFESVLDSANAAKSVQTRDQSATKPVDEAALASSSSKSHPLGGGHKSIRNIQPVFMRLPPRFGKRSQRP